MTTRDIYELKIYLDSDDSLVAIALDAFNIFHTETMNETPSLEFELFSDSLRVEFMDLRYYIKIYNKVDDTYSCKYYIDNSETISSEAELTFKTTWLGKINQLYDEDDVEYNSGTFDHSATTIATTLINSQSVYPTEKQITLGTISIVGAIRFVVSNISILSAFILANEGFDGYSITEWTGIGGIFYVDADDKFQWEELPDAPNAILHTQKNIVVLEHDLDFKIFTNLMRLLFADGSTGLDNMGMFYLNNIVDTPGVGEQVYYRNPTSGLSLGGDYYEFTNIFGVGSIIMDGFNISSASTVEYWKVGNQLHDATRTKNFGTITKILKEGNRVVMNPDDNIHYTDSQSISDYGYAIHQRKLPEWGYGGGYTNIHNALIYGYNLLQSLKTPRLNYVIKAISYEGDTQYDYDLEHVAVGDLVRIIDPELNIDSNVRVASITQQLDMVENITLELNSPKTKLSDLFMNVK